MLSERQTLLAKECLLIKIIVERRWSAPGDKILDNHWAIRDNVSIAPPEI